MQFIKPDINLNFMGKRKLFLMVSAVMVLLSFLVIIVKDINYGIDFDGGILVQVKFEKQVSADQIRSSMAAIGLTDAMVQSFGSDADNEFLIRSAAHDMNLDTLEGQVLASLKSTTGDEKVTARRTETVGAKAGQDLRANALLALFFSLLLMGVYISGRFEHKWVLAGVMALALSGTAIVLQSILQYFNITGDLAMVLMIAAVLAVTFLACVFLRLRYATGAVVSTAHDAVVTVGIYCLLGREFNLSTVAALLTVIGFSVNDTIIIYDRIRENLRKGLRLELADLINRSINQTLSRTVLTSGTLLIVVLILFIFGGGVIEDFALVMVIGVIVATYSSIFVASPIMYMVPETRKKVVRGAASPSRPVKARQAASETTQPEEDDDGTKAEATKAVKTRGKKSAAGRRRRR